MVTKERRKFHSRKILKNTRVLTLRPDKRPDKRWENARDCIGSRAKIRHMVANIYYTLKFVSLQNSFETCGEICSSVIQFDRVGN